MHRERPPLPFARQRERVDSGEAGGHGREVARQARRTSPDRLDHQAAPGEARARLDPPAEGRRASARRGMGETRLLVVEIVFRPELELAGPRQAQQPRRAGEAHMVVEQTLDGHPLERAARDVGEAVHAPQPGMGGVKIESRDGRSLRWHDPDQVPWVCSQPGRSAPDTPAALSVLTT